MEQKNHLNQHTDYYPWGMPARPYPPYGEGGGEMPGRTGNPNDYRHGYQGTFAERDAETNFNSFELRQYDARLARWMSTDPYYQHHSPYLAMGNNPVSGVDPDGGFVDGFLTKAVTTILQYGSVKNLTPFITQTTTTLTTFGKILTGVVMTASKVLENTTSAGAGSGNPSGTGQANTANTPKTSGGWDNFRQRQDVEIIDQSNTNGNGRAAQTDAQGNQFTFQWKRDVPGRVSRQQPGGTPADMDSEIWPEKLNATDPVNAIRRANNRYGQGSYIIIRVYGGTVQREPFAEDVDTYNYYAIPGGSIQYNPGTNNVNFVY